MCLREVLNQAEYEAPLDETETDLNVRHYSAMTRIE